jgi:hypothetical protein
MSPSVHIVQGAVSAAVLYPVVGVPAIPFGLAVVLIDLDHLLTYLWDTGDWTFRGFFVYNHVLLQNLHTGYLGLSPFHTVEFYLLCLLLAPWQPIIYPVLAGCLFHHLFDLVNLVRLGHPFCKSLTITDYLLRRKKHVATIRDVLAHPDSRLEGINGTEEWAARWGVAQAEKERRS